MHLGRLTILIFTALFLFGCQTFEPVKQPELGVPWVVPELGLVLESIPAGSFQMGEKDRSGGSEPIHTVHISNPYWLGRHEVTNGQYQAFLKASKYIGKLDASNFLDHHREDVMDASTEPDFPVVFVNWKNATAFCKWLTTRERAAGRLPEGYEYRLPSEAEWEYACRAGSTMRYSFGDKKKQLDDYAWYRPNNGWKTQQVGTKKPNQWGLYDMYGNVSEWCYDWDWDYTKETMTDPIGPATGRSRIIRGGSNSYAASQISSASRGRATAILANYDLGFRVALAPVIQDESDQTQ